MTPFPAPSKTSWPIANYRASSRHGFKYRAVYAVEGVRIVGFDNERGKGDHQHLGALERPYLFTTVDRLVEDFIAAIDAARGGDE
jgi:hypothetical protein